LATSSNCGAATPRPVAQTPGGAGAAATPATAPRGSDDGAGPLRVPEKQGKSAQGAPRSSAVRKGGTHLVTRVTRSMSISLLFLVLTSQVGSASAWVECSDVSQCMYDGCGNLPCACLASQGPNCVNGFWNSNLGYQGKTGVSSCRQGKWQPLCEQIGMVVAGCYNFFLEPGSSGTYSFQSCPDLPELPECPTGTYSDDGKNGIGDKACRKCPANSMPENDTHDYLKKKGSKECLCNAGYTGTPPQCSACDEGKYKESPSYSSEASVCDKCHSGTGTSVRGSTSRANCSCDTGYTDYKFDNLGGWCKQCERNTYKGSRGNGPCTSCPNNTEHPLVLGNQLFGNTHVNSCTPVIKPKCEKNYFTADCPVPASGSQSQGVCKALMVVGLVVGIVFM
jgi:hypothetical protein